MSNMSKVYVLIRRNKINENEVVGVFSTRKKATVAFKKCIDKYKPKNDKVLLKMYQDCVNNLSAEIHGFCVCEVQEFEVQ